jgi:hypothetical protein
MSSDFSSSNPYVSPAVAVFERPGAREQAPASVLAAGMALIAVAGIGLAISIFNFVFSFGTAHITPDAPEMVRKIQEGAVGPVATAIQGTFAMVNLFILLSGVQMVRLQNWGMAVAGSVLAILNIGSCCCVVGLPVGIWSLFVLMSPDVMSIFSAVKGQAPGGLV